MCDRNAVSISPHSQIKVFAGQSPLPHCLWQGWLYPTPSISSLPDEASVTPPTRRPEFSSSEPVGREELPQGWQEGGGFLWSIFPVLPNKLGLDYPYAVLTKGRLHTTVLVLQMRKLRLSYGVLLTAREESTLPNPFLSLCLWDTEEGWLSNGHGLGQIQSGQPVCASVKAKTLSSGEERFRAEPLGPKGNAPIGPPWVLREGRSIKAMYTPQLLSMQFRVKSCLTIVRAREEGAVMAGCLEEAHIGINGLKSLIGMRAAQEVQILQEAPAGKINLHMGGPWLPCLRRRADYGQRTWAFRPKSFPQHLWAV